jgi:NADH-quinone oxidoreductase subunit N
MDNVSSLAYFLPELILTASIVIVLVADLIFKKSKEFLVPLISVGALIITIFFTIAQYSKGLESLFFNMIVLDGMAIFFKLLVTVATIFIMFFSMPQKQIKSEYYVLLLAIVLGMFLMVSSSDLLMMLISLEIVGLASYVLAGINKDNLKSSEAALKYVLFGAASTGVMAFGMSFLYGMTGETNLFAIQNQLMVTQPPAISVFISVILILAGLGYKIAMVPFHFWVPDVYEGAPTPITAFFSVAPKAAGIGLLARFMTSTVGHQISTGATEWVQNIEINAPLLLSVLSILTMTLGNLIALKQSNVKRMMAYSSIAHAGYILMAFVVFSSVGYMAVMLYIAIYLLMNFGAFWIIHIIAEKLGSEEIETYHGLGYRAPFASICMAIFMFSLTGLPPLAGFIGKFYLFAAIIEQNWYWLAVIGVLNSVISLYYYAGVVKAMFLVKIDNPKEVSISLYDKVLLAVLTIPLLIFGVYWTPLLNWTTSSIEIFTK